uniref:Synaptotagmin-like mitochondrial and lipid-binding domain-containing protein n=1 Tax=Arion vulgaris TaxID=1028688 RepID=A0A0B7AMH6_9EUPU
MAEAGRSWYTELDFDSYVLDLLLIGWCTLCFLIILAVNAIVSAFGPLQKQPQERIRGETEGKSLTGAVLPVETAKWFTDAISWCYLHYYHSPEFTVEWLKALNEQLVRLGGPVQAKFDRIQPGSLPPRVTHVSSEASPQDRFIIHAKLEARDLSFVVFASQQTHEGVKLTNVTANVLRLKGTLRVHSYREGADVKISFNFEGKPEIKVLVKPLNPYQDTNELVDLGVVEANVRNSIILAKTTFTVTHLLMPGNLNTVNHDFGDKGGGQDQSKDKNSPSSNAQPRDTQNQPKPASSPANSANQQQGQQKQKDTKEQQSTEHEVLKAASTLPNNMSPPVLSNFIQNESLQATDDLNNLYPLNNQQQPIALKA